MNRSTPPPTDPPNEDPWTGPSQWFNYRCRSCNHIDWVEDIGALAFPPEYPGGCAVLQPLPAEWWELLIQQIQEAEKVQDPVGRLSKPPLQLRVNPEELTDPPTRLPSPESGKPTLASEIDLRPADAKAA